MHPSGNFAGYASVMQLTVNVQGLGKCGLTCLTRLGTYDGTFVTPETGFLCVALAVLELALYTRLASNSDQPASASGVRGLKACTSTIRLLYN